jgi:quercetin dioxygenase-like cupin family protein
MSAAAQAGAKQMPEAEVVQLGATVAYQDGAVVSRTLVKGPTGTITAFAFDAGQALSEHTAAFDALVQVLEGEAEITISRKPFQLREGEVILLPAQQPHAVSATTRFKMLLTMIRS